MSRAATCDAPPSHPPLVARVHAELARGGFQSGAELARRLGVSRGAVWKAVVSLKGLGLTVHAVRNRGYRLAEPSEALDAARIRAQLPEAVRLKIRKLEAFWSLASTNATLLARTDLPCGLADVVLAEYQTAGRGRRGRSWLAPPGGAICLSVSWCFAQVPRDLGALGLAAGVCALRALRPRVPSPIALKWPNDLTIGARKLGGILIELRAESAGPAYVVIGLGLNVALGPKLSEQIAASGNEPTDLKSAGADPLPRNAIVAELIGAIVPGLEAFEQDGLRPFIDSWQRADALRGLVVNVFSGEHTVRGVARGIDTSGALLVETPRGQVEKFVSGDVSVRPEA